MSRYRKESFTRVEGYEDNMYSSDEGEDAYGEVENSRSSGGPLESLFAALQGQFFWGQPSPLNTIYSYQTA